MEFDSLVNKKKIVLTCKNLHDGDIEVLAEVLEKSTVVEEMNLMMNQITLSDDKFTDALARNKSLKVLNLYGNKIGAEVCATSTYGIFLSVIPNPSFFNVHPFPHLTRVQLCRERNGWPKHYRTIKLSNNSTWRGPR